MLTIVASTAALALLLLLTEFLGRKRVLGPELKRKSFHVISGSFIAFWPWLMSWRTIEILGLGMVALLMANHFLKVFNFTRGIGRRTFGDTFLAIAISTSAYLSHSKIFFALAILNVSLADGLAALVGKRYGRHWPYKILGQDKTVLGTMTFWLVSLLVTAGCLLSAHNQMNFNEYVFLIIILPPVMAALENFSYLGIDNLTVPLAAIVLLRTLS